MITIAARLTWPSQSSEVEPMDRFSSFIEAALCNSCPKGTVRSQSQETVGIWTLNWPSA